MKINHISILILFLGSIVIMSCGSKEQVVKETHTEEKNTVTFSEAQFKNADIELGSIEQKQISRTIRVNGTLDVPPQQMVSVSVPVGGFLKSTLLLQGSSVKRGQVIATIENLDFIQFQQDYLEAINQMAFSQTDLTRQQELAKENVNAQKTLQQAQTTYTSWLTKANALHEKLKMLNIDPTSLNAGNMSSTINLYTPISGYVTDVNVNIGKFVNPSDILFEIVDTRHLHAELIVFEKDVPKLKIGQKVRFTLANEMKERIATVYLLGREISSDRTIRIHCHIDKEDSNLLPGMYLKAIVETAGVEVYALPDQAILDFQGKKYIFYQATDQTGPEYHFITIEIEIGNSELGFTEVILPSNFSTGTARVVTKNAYAILSKMKNNEEAGETH